MPRLEDGAIACDVGVFCGGATVASEQDAHDAGWLVEEVTNTDRSARWAHCVCSACLAFQNLAPGSGTKAPS